MPGSILALTPHMVRGTATHPRHRAYVMTVHVLMQGRRIATALAALMQDGRAQGFEIRFETTMNPQHLQVVLGETDEYLQMPAVHAPARPHRTVEDLIATPAPRPWVNGACTIDAEQAGLLPETVVDMLCRDFLGRPAGASTIGSSLRRLQEGQDYEAVRRTLLQSVEFRQRAVYADNLPGAIFSQRMLMQAASADFPSAGRVGGKVLTVSARKLLELNGETFLAACYRQILRKEPDRSGIEYYMHQMTNGRTRVEILRHLANELDAISAGVHVVDLPA